MAEQLALDGAKVISDLATMPPEDAIVTVDAGNFQEWVHRFYLVGRGGTFVGTASDALGVSKGAVSQWMKRARQGGVEALKRQLAPGAQPRLSEEQRAERPELLQRGAEAHGFRGDVWTCARVAEVIRREFRVSYRPAHVSGLLKACFREEAEVVGEACVGGERAVQEDQCWPSSRLFIRICGLRAQSGKAGYLVGVRFGHLFSRGEY